MSGGLSVTELAARIDAHLKRFERDPEINKLSGRGLRRFFNAGAWRGGSRVMVVYISYQGASSMTKDEAERYLTWLDAGNVGRHYEALRGGGEDGAA